jgi:hypothetical protein
MPFVAGHGGTGDTAISVGRERGSFNGGPEPALATTALSADAVSGLAVIMKPLPHDCLAHQSALPNATGIGDSFDRIVLTASISRSELMVAGLTR